MLPYGRMKGLTDVDGILVGHVTDLELRTGCTVILCGGQRGAVGGVDIRGTATGSVQLDVLTPLHSNERIHGICLSGGSAYGLEAASGVMRYLESKDIGFPVGAAGVVPLVPGVILFDLPMIAKKGFRPGREMGEAAARAATADAVAEGTVGAGTGATVGKLFGMKRAMKGGVGSATVWLDGPMAGVRVAALAVTNSFGDVRDPESGHILAGARVSAEDREFVDAAHMIKRGARGGFNFKAETNPAQTPANTTLVVVATNARLSKVQANRLAQQASIGMAKTISPIWTGSDGDVCFAVSIGEAEADPMALGIAAAEAVAQAIVRSVLMARGLGGVPGLSD